MFYIIVIHILGHGGLLDATVGVRNSIAWLIEFSVCSAVDIYALISGYVGYSEEPKLIISSKYLSMWLQVFCYSFGITAIAFIIAPDSVGLRNLFKSIFPVTTSQYWYFSAFTGVFLLKPWLNCFIRKLSKNDLTVFIVVVVGSISFLSTIAIRLGDDPYKLNGGRCLLWLVLLYIVGAWLKLYGNNEIGKRKSLLLIVSCTVFMWICSLCVPRVVGVGLLNSNVNPLVLISAIAYVVAFSKLNLSKVVEKLVEFFAPAAFGVYLIHDNFFIREHYISKFSYWIAGLNAWEIPLFIFGAAIIVFTVCIFLEKLRLIIFKLLKINAFIRLLGRKIDHILSKLNNKIAQS